VLERASPPPLPFDPASLGGGRADAVLTAAGFVQPAAGHNAMGELRLSLGAAGSDEAWQVALLPFMGALATLAEKQAPLSSHAHATPSRQRWRAESMSASTRRPDTWCSHRCATGCCQLSRAEIASRLIFINKT